jgi:hypothetical protein
MAIIDINGGPDGDLRSTGTDNTTKIKNRINSSAVKQGDIVYFPAGDYYVSGNILDRDDTNCALTIQGDDVDATRILLISSGALSSTAVFRIVGGTNAALWFQMRNIELNGYSRTTTAPWIEFTKVSYTRLEHVYITQTIGQGLHAKQWRDSVCHDLQFGVVGSPTVAQMTVESNGTGSTQSQDLVFDACRWEGNPNRALELISTIRVELLGCKWHGALPPTNSVGHILLDGTYLTSFSACRLANSKSNMIDGSGGSGLLVNACMINGAAQPSSIGIYLNGTNYSVIYGNYFKNTANIQDSGTGNSTTGNILA